MATTTRERPMTVPTGSRRRLVWAGVVWTAAIQYFVMLLVVQAAWPTPYSLVVNAISDLGAVNCGVFDGREICSPWHLAANISWVVAGLSISAGMVLFRRFLPAGAAARIGTILMFVAGLALASVGLNPEDVSAVHIPSAVVAIGLGLPAIILLGTALRRARGWGAAAWSGMLMGAIGLLSGALLFVTPTAMFGLFERFAAFPILVWAIVCGVNALTRAFDARESARG